MEINKITEEQKRAIDEMRENGVTLNRESIIMVRMSASCHYPKELNETGKSVAWVENAESSIQKMGDEEMDASDLIAAALIIINGILDRSDLNSSEKSGFRSAVMKFVNEDTLSRRVMTSNAIGMAIQPQLIKNGITEMSSAVSD